MDLVMDWRLIYRSDADMLELASSIPRDEAQIRIWTDPLSSVAYMTVTRR